MVGGGSHAAGWAFRVALRRSGRRRPGAEARLLPPRSRGSEGDLHLETTAGTTVHGQGGSVRACDRLHDRQPEAVTVASDDTLLAMALERLEEALDVG